MKVGDRVRVNGSYYLKFDGKTGVIDEIFNEGEPKVMVCFSRGENKIPDWRLCNSEDLKVLADEK